MRPRNMHNLIERIVKGIKVIDATQNPMEFDMSDDAVEAWTEMYGEKPNTESFSKFINKALVSLLETKQSSK
jgi:hypothetical protein